MAAPPVTARVVPSGFKLQDGFKTTIALATNPAIQFWEKTVKPPGVDGGDPIPQTTMLNFVWRTFAPRSLKTLMAVTGKAAYDPNFYSGIIAITNLPTAATVQLPSHVQLSFYCYLQKIDFDDNEEGKQPECAYTLAITNYDWVNNVEAGPVITVAGTA